MYRDLRYGPKRYFFQKVAECPVYQGRQVVRLAWDTKVENADMSNDKECVKHSRRKSKGFYDRLIHVELCGP
jgi:hypothetical protein